MGTSHTSKKWVYLFREGNAAMRDLLGGKGAGLAEMTNAQFPVPPGFTVTTEACNAYYKAGEAFPSGVWEQVLEAMNEIEMASGKKFGDPSNPLLVSVRSGASVSMPGMMDTVLNLGLTYATVKGIAHISSNERFAYDAYRRFIQMFGKVVMDVPGESFEKILDEYKRQVNAATDVDLTTVHLKEIVAQFLALALAETGKEFPQNPLEQLELATRAVFASWNGKRAIDYRNFYGISHTLGTAVNIVEMVFGNMGDDSGSGVAFTRDPSTGAKLLYGEYLSNAQGEDVVAGIRTPQKIDELARTMPEQYRELLDISARLETHYKDAQDIEFTIEKGRLYILQTRSAKRTAQATVKIAVDMGTEGLISKPEAVQRVHPDQINHLLLPRFSEASKQQAIELGNLLAKGLNASPGAANGKAVFDADRTEQMGKQGESIILVRPETNPDDVHGMLWAKGVLTARGGATSHAAVVARGLGKPCVAGVEALTVDLESRRCTMDGRVIEEGDEISIDGTTGEIFIGHLATLEPDLSGETALLSLLEWANEIKQLGVWANADNPRDAQVALDFGAEGIGLCRTEHMFFEEERLPVVRQMILAATEATKLEKEMKNLEEAQANGNLTKDGEQLISEKRTQVAESKEIQMYYDALDSLLKFQVQDFKGILRVMNGKPVIIRLLDPPLHEFLPRYEDLLVEVTTLRLRGDDPARLAEMEHLMGMVNEMREMNPMLGLRGCRLGLMYEAINRMQARAIFTASCELMKEGLDPRPEIMVPLVGHANELRLVREELEYVGEEVQREQDMQVSYKIGTMIELPRAALTADAVARYAQFFSFGTNDLTQTTYGFSRDDAEGGFLLQYVTRGILPENPFQVLDRDGVGKLIKTAVDLGRSTTPDLEVGICGEHGGDPSSIEFCASVGLDYVSASPFRVPVARLAAAHVALASSGFGSQVMDV